MTSNSGEWKSLFDRDAPVVSTAAFFIHHVERVVIDCGRDHGVLERADDRRALRQGAGARLGCNYLATVLQSVLNHDLQSERWSEKRRLRFGGVSTLDARPCDQERSGRDDPEIRKLCRRGA